MSNFTIRPAIAATVPALAVLALTLGPIASQADSNSTKAKPPVALTGPAHVVGASVVLDGTINSHDQEVTYQFEYGPGTGPNDAVPTEYPLKTPLVKLAAKETKEKVSAAAPNIQAGDHYRLLVTAPADPKTVEGKDAVYEPKVPHTKSGFDLPTSFEPTLVGEAFLLGGTLTGSDNGEREVVLQASLYPFTASFVDLGSPVLTSSSGGFTFRVAHLTESTRFRVATVTPPVLLSPSFTQLALVHVSLKVRRSKRVEGLVRLYGTVSPAEVGAHVFLQLEQPPKAQTLKSEKLEKGSHSGEHEPQPQFRTRFNTIVKHGGKSFSRFSIVVNVRASGNYRALVQLAPGPLASGTSQTVILHAAPRSKQQKNT